MSNWLKMSEVHTIEQLLKNGWSARRIARELRIHRDTVSRYAKKADAASPPKQAISTAGDKKALEGEETEQSVVSKRRPGRQGSCDPLRGLIEEKVAVGLNAQRIWQDLRDDHGYTAGYESVKRFVRKLRASSPLPFRRIETLPGEEAQIDFGQGGATKRPGKRHLRRPHVLRVVLSNSRKGYSEACWHQDAESFLRILENAFFAFGGVPKTLVVDNLKAAVLKADWFDPELNPKLESFARHYGTVILPTKPRTPRHKGKVERGVDYVQENAVKGRTFESIEEQNAFLREWEKNIADQRVHGTTKKQVRSTFEAERPHLGPLPRERFPVFAEGRRVVSRDGHIAVAKGFYSLPPEYLGHTVVARYDSHIVSVFDLKMNEVAMHLRVEPGQYSTHRAHIHAFKQSGVERGLEWNLDRARKIGEHTAAYAQGLLNARGIAGVRPLLGLLSLAHKHPWKHVEECCRLAHQHGEYRLRTLRELLKRTEPLPEQTEFLDNHPLIRSPLEYGDLAREAFSNSPVVECEAVCERL